MEQEKPLPGVYYRPAIPPPQRKKPTRCLCCLFSTFLAVMLGLVILFAVLVLVLWLVFRPVYVEANVRTATLSQFNLTAISGENGLTYNLSAVVDLRNPNDRMGIYYDSVEATASYEGMRLGFSSLPHFYQATKNTTTLYPAMSGLSIISLSSSEFQTFELQRRAGSFDVTLELRCRIRFKLGSDFRTASTTMRVRCDMALPFGLPSRGSKCDVRW
uniref:Putative harpin-induced protein 1 n=1 Tax=Wolffia arrhiza TaxID=161111 RepID=D2KL30_WOLAR|nr:putative harpin-induced protein 1 [Wolffia arrhiza]